MSPDPPSPDLGRPAVPGPGQRPRPGPPDRPGRSPRCPRCGARTSPDVPWCGQCHALLDPAGRSAGGPGPVPAPAPGGPGGTLPDTPAQPVPAEPPDPPRRPRTGRRAAAEEGSGTVAQAPGTWRIPPDPATGRQLVGGRVPAERVEAMLHRLAEESGPVLPGRAAALTGRGPRAALAVGGGLAVTLLLVAVLALLGRVV